jgi:hypothetical protein
VVKQRRKRRRKIVDKALNCTIDVIVLSVSAFIVWWGWGKSVLCLIKSLKE